ncbi:protein LURP-one-related 11-like isoform X2 [Solanum stenotomum]|uniref:protein LURP-one-related 11-like isoform X1 n=1 Tax=Solanum stenotomum TaxID=172797 RepID=UPI0020D13185|nr:protein LURP-one-related 11-like isoform X1 [Solanum stenotomum]XP_049377111.1 protein LURP-one-related 11-like isoform X2 [Solanum stenotomum]
MAKICPEFMLQQSSPSSSSPYVKSIREAFTIWMKSLIFHGNGCTVFNSKGEIVFRVDNYQESCRDEVCIMDLKGQVLFSIKREKLRVFGRWNGYGSFGEIKGRPLFQVKRNCDIFSRENVICNFGSCDENNVGINCYKIQQFDRNSSYKVTNSTGQVVAEVKQKQSSRGFGYGEDVLTLEVEPNIDHSLIVAFVIVCGLIHGKL